MAFNTQNTILMVDGDVLGKVFEFETHASVHTSKTSFRLLRAPLPGITQEYTGYVYATTYDAKTGRQIYDLRVRKIEEVGKLDLTASVPTFAERLQKKYRK